MPAGPGDYTPYIGSWGGIFIAMIIVRVAKYFLSSPKWMDRAVRGALVLLAGAAMVLLWGVKLETIPCHSEQSIKLGGYTAEAVELKVEPRVSHLDPDYDRHNTILLTGQPANARLIAQIHQNALKMKTRTKGYSIELPAPGRLARAQYFLVLEISAGPSTRVVLENRGWQPNSDVLALFINKLDVVSSTSWRSLFFPSKGFNEIAIETNEKEIDKVLDVLWHINNLYSHSLGVYFYWVVGSQAVFLSGQVLLVLALAGCLVLLELAAGGDFRVRLFSTKLPLLVAALVCPGSALLFRGLTFFERFVLYWLLLPLVFPVALALAGEALLLQCCWFIGRAVQEKADKWRSSRPRV